MTQPFDENEFEDRDLDQEQLVPYQDVRFQDTGVFLDPTRAGSREEALTKFTHCGQCGSRVHFSYQTDFAQNLSYEIGKCPECERGARNHLHRLH
jgi:hypothetical protein